MTSNASGISAPAASTETTASPDRDAVLFGLVVDSGLQLAQQREALARIVAAADLDEDGDLIVRTPLRAVDTMTPQQRADAEDARYRAAARAARDCGSTDPAVQIDAILTALGRTDLLASSVVPSLPAGKRRGHLTLVHDPLPEQHDTPCPPGCAVDHSNLNEDGDCHYTEPATVGPSLLILNVNPDNSVALELLIDGVNGHWFDLAGVDDLLSKLTAKRAEMAAEIARRTPLRPTGGAA